MGDIIIAGQRFSVDAPIVNFQEAPFWDATAEHCVGSDACAQGIFPYGHGVKNQRARRYSYRAALRRYGAHPPLEAVRAIIRQFVVHHDGCPDSTTCWNVLHNERGLSCHFLIDNDGTIYQTLDLAYNGYHAADFNPHSIGVELSNRGDALKDQAYYSRRGMKRDMRPVKVHGHTYLAFDYTPEQYQAMKSLAGGLARLLPNLPLEYPQDLPGHQAWGMLEGGQGYSGYLGHYHCTTRKWDPGPFDLKAFCEALRGAMCFPIAVPPSPDPTQKPLVPKTAEDVKTAVTALYRANEEQADGGFFPFGPWGESRLWHGGVHLVAPHKAPVFAPFAGRVVAARMGGTSAVGSTNFVLIKHRMNVGRESVLFFSLFMHLADVRAKDERGRKVPRWLAALTPKASLKPGVVALCDEPIEGGELLGYVGLAGPHQYERAQLHFAVFSPGELFRDAAPSPWTVYDGTAGGRFCDIDELIALVDTNRDGEVSRPELSGLFSQPGDRDVLRWLVTYNVSEWTSEPSWFDALQATPAAQDIAPGELQERVDQEITPGLWWSDAVARHAGLPRDGVVYHYHPISFVQYVTGRIAEAAALPMEIANVNQAAATPDGVTDDLGDTRGDEAVSDADLAEEDPYRDLTLEEMATGYDALIE